MKTTFEKVKNYSELLVLSFDLLAIFLFIINLFSFLKFKNYMLQISLFNLILLITIIILTGLYFYIKIGNIRKQKNENLENKIISKYINYRISYFGTIENGIASEKLHLHEYFNEYEISVLIENGYINLTLK